MFDWGPGKLFDAQHFLSEILGLPIRVSLYYGCPDFVAEFELLLFNDDVDEEDQENGTKDGSGRPLERKIDARNEDRITKAIAEVRMSSFYFSSPPLPFRFSSFSVLHQDCTRVRE